MTSRAQLAAKELLRRHNAKTDIENFCDFMRPTGLLDFKHKPAAHHKLIFNHLKKMVIGDLYKFICSMPPGSAKSTVISVQLPCFLLAIDPTLQILCISNSEAIAENFARRRRAILKSKQWQLLSDTALAPDQQALGAMGTLEGGGIYCAGAGSVITGLRCDWLISDDLVTGHEQANSLPQLDKIWNWYLSEARSRLRPNGREIILGTRWAAQDPIGRVLELVDNCVEEWKYLRLPMLCDDVNDPLGRELGERLWPQWFDKKMVEEAQRSPRIWTTLYQQKPIDDEGAWVPFDHFHIEHFAPKSLRYVIGCDIAISEGRGDFTVFIVCGLDYSKNIWVVDCYRKQTDTGTSARALLDLCKRYKPTHVFSDNDGASQVWSRLVAEIQRSYGFCVPLQMLPMKQRDKETRNSVLRSYLLQNVVRFVKAPWNDVVIDELNRFPGGRNDDIVDALGLVARQVIKLSPPHNPAKQQIHIETQLSLVNNKIVTNSTMDEMFEHRERILKYQHARF